MTSPNDECRPRPESGTHKIDPPKITKSVAEPDDWLEDYPEPVREAVRMDRRRRVASLRLPPLPSGKRDPWDRVRRDGREAA
jgi:hypothetical protein